LASTLVLSETAGPEGIDGPGASVVMVSGNNAVEVFSVTSGVTASLSGLTILDGLGPQGGGLSIISGTVSLTKVAVSNNQAVGTGAASGGGIYLNGGSLALIDDVVAHNTARGGNGGGSPSGYYGGDGGSAAGGGIYVADGSLVLNKVVVESNQA